MERGTDPRSCSARRMNVCALWRRGYGYLCIANRSANMRLQLPCVRGAVSLSRVEKKQYIVQSSSNPVGRKSDASIENCSLYPCGQGQAQSLRVLAGTSPMPTGRGQVQIQFLRMEIATTKVQKLLRSLRRCPFTCGTLLPQNLHPSHRRTILR
jgi:hypothetical protein